MARKKGIMLGQIRIIWGIRNRKMVVEYLSLLLNSSR